MVLILEVTGPQAAQLGSDCRKVFGVEGGLIGRDSRSAWVLPSTKVSGRHARINHQHGIFYIEDTSTNGVFINASKSRLGKGRSYALKSGDAIFIDPYTISVSVGSSGCDEPRQHVPQPPARRSAAPHDDPFNLDDPFGEQAVPFGEQIVPSPHDLHSEPLSGQEVDPLKLLGREAPRHQVVRNAPRAQDLELSAPIHGHFKPPQVVAQATPPPGSTPVPEAPGDPFAIPADYDPLKPDTKYGAVRKDSGPAAPRTPNAPPPTPPTLPPRIEREPEPPYRDPGPGEIVDEDGPSPVGELDLSMFDAPLVPEAPPPEPRPSPASSKITPATPAPAPAPVAPRVSNAVPAPAAAPRPTPIPVPPPSVDALPPGRTSAPAGEGMTIDLRSLLEGAGLDPEDVTPDLARNLGAILRVVVAGVMEVLQARHNVKDEFRMRVTQFRPADNNPLKFSANVDDALHNLLVKRNAAYLEPVEAFDDAFDDLRHHQLAMLAGMRTAFEAMLNEFQPDRLREQFDRQGKSLLNVAAKLRYWDLYRDMHEDLVKDPDETFRRLFGDAFAKAYEEQLTRLKAQNDPATPRSRRREPD